MRPVYDNFDSLTRTTIFSPYLFFRIYTYSDIHISLIVSGTYINNTAAAKTIFVCIVANKRNYKNEEAPRTNRSATNMQIVCAVCVCERERTMTFTYIRPHEIDFLDGVARER